MPTYEVRFIEQWWWWSGLSQQPTKPSTHIHTWSTYLLIKSTNGVMDENPSHSPAGDQVALGHAWADQDGNLITHGCQWMKLFPLEHHFSIGLIRNNRKSMLLGNYRKSEMLVDTGIEERKVLGCSQLAIFCKCSFEKTEPQGLLGLLMIIAAVLSSINRSMSSKSISQRFSGWWGGRQRERDRERHRERDRDRMLQSYQ